MSSRKRKRLSRDQIRSSTKNSGGGSLAKCFNLPEGVEIWSPDKKGNYDLDILPYLVTTKNHPDQGVEKDAIWWRREIVIHGGLGDGRQMAICPQVIGKKCPIHEARAKLAKKKDADEEVLKALNGKRFILMNMKDQEDRKKVALFVMSSGKIWSFKGGGLKKEIEDGPEENLTFFDTKDGKTLKVRFSQENFAGKDFLQASRFDFKDRKDMNEDEVLKKTVDLDHCFIVHPYDKLKSMFEETEGATSSASSSSEESESEEESTSESEESESESKEEEESESSEEEEEESESSEEEEESESESKESE